MRARPSRTRTRAANTSSSSTLRRKGYGTGYIKRVLASGAAALRWSYRRGELQAVPHVITVADSEPRERILEAERSRALWSAAEQLELRR